MSRGERNEVIYGKWPVERCDSVPEATEASQKYLEELVSVRTEQLRQSMSDVEYAQDCILEAYGDALQLKHPATAAHSRRLVPFSIALGWS